jgi:hypothetical protein
MIGEAVATFRGDEVEGRRAAARAAGRRAHPRDVHRQRAAAARGLPEAVGRGIPQCARRRHRPRPRGARGPLRRGAGGCRGLFQIARLRRRAAQSQLSDVVAMGPNLRVVPAPASDSLRVRLQRLYPKSKVLAGGEAMVVPLPTAGGEPLADADLIAWTPSCSTSSTHCPSAPTSDSRRGRRTRPGQSGDRAGREHHDGRDAPRGPGRTTPTPAARTRARRSRRRARANRIVPGTRTSIASSTYSPPAA